MSSTFLRYLLPGEDTVLGKWMKRGERQPDELECGIRVVDGEIPGESSRWSFRRSWVDPFPSDAVALSHGPTKLRLRLDPEVWASSRPGHVEHDAEELESGASVRISFPDGEQDRFGV
jgi:hypothetical protein